jgi:hypothetical protein
VQLVQTMRGQQIWVRKVEHIVLRVVSLGFSLASAHAIRWFFAPLDGVDALQPAITWTVAAGFGILGHIVSRGLAHRLMNKERIRAYAPICAVVEIVEIFCNYALAAAVIQRATWLRVIPTDQRAVLTGFTYLVLSIIPLVSLLLAVVDMDLERSKLHGVGPLGGGIGSPAFNGNRGPFSAAPSMPALRYQAQPQPQPKDGSFVSGPGAAAAPAPSPAYSQGYAGSAPVMAQDALAMPPLPSLQPQQAPHKPGGMLSTIPFLGKRENPTPAPTVVLPSTQ